MSREVPEEVVWGNQTDDDGLANFGRNDFVDPDAQKKVVNRQDANDIASAEAREILEDIDRADEFHEKTLGIISQDQEQKELKRIKYIQLFAKLVKEYRPDGICSCGTKVELPSGWHIQYKKMVITDSKGQPITIKKHCGLLCAVCSMYEKRKLVKPVISKHKILSHVEHFYHVNGEMLAACREESGLSQGQLCKLIGKSKSWWVGLEKGGHRISHFDYLKLLNIFKDHNYLPGDLAE